MGAGTVSLLVGWIPSVGLILFGVLVSTLFISYYEHRHYRDLYSRYTAIIGLSLPLMTCLLLPFDAFIVSFMKNNDGTFKDWANNTSDREVIGNAVLYMYYALLVGITLFIFIVCPLVYFYSEEADSHASDGERCRMAFFYSLVFIVAAVLLFIAGAFIPWKRIPQLNITEPAWENLQHLFDKTDPTRAESALCFVVSVSTFFGMFTLIQYMGVGIGAYPIHLIKGWRNVHSETGELIHRRLVIQGQIRNIENKGNTRLSAAECSQLETLKDEERLINSRLQWLEKAEASRWRKCLLALHPFQIVAGTILFLLAIVIITSLVISNIDRLLNSHSPKGGYILVDYELPVITDIIFLFCGKVPLLADVLFAITVFFLFASTVGGMYTIGLWFLWIRICKIHPHKMKPQGILILSYHLVYVGLAANVFLHQIAPHYLTYGSQRYKVNDTSSESNLTSQVTMLCNLEAPPDQCLMTQISGILFRFYYKFSFFAAAYYWLSWLFVLVSMTAFIVAVVKKRRPLSGGVELDDLDEEVQPLLPNQ